jgi:hypothetical protein
MTATTRTVSHRARRELLTATRSSDRLQFVIPMTSLKSRLWACCGYRCKCAYDAVRGDSTSIPAQGSVGRQTRRKSPDTRHTPPN